MNGATGARSRSISDWNNLRHQFGNHFGRSRTKSDKVGQSRTQSEIKSEIRKKSKNCAQSRGVRSPTPRSRRRRRQVLSQGRRQGASPVPRHPPTTPPRSRSRPPLQGVRSPLPPSPRRMTTSWRNMVTACRRRSLLHGRLDPSTKSSATRHRLRDLVRQCR
jgi:hypothetical protein